MKVNAVAPLLFRHGRPRADHPGIDGRLDGRVKPGHDDMKNGFNPLEDAWHLAKVNPEPSIHDSL
jgi:hypothetical protein